MKIRSLALLISFLLALNLNAQEVKMLSTCSIISNSLNGDIISTQGVVDYTDGVSTFLLRYNTCYIICFEKNGLMPELGEFISLKGVIIKNSTSTNPTIQIYNWISIYSADFLTYVPSKNSFHLPKDDQMELSDLYLVDETQSQLFFQPYDIYGNEIQDLYNYDISMGYNRSFINTSVNLK